MYQDLYAPPATLQGSILWGNSAPNDTQLFTYNGIATDFNDIQGGGFGGTGNIDADPLFVTGAGGDFLLSQIAAGQGMDSPAVDAGDPGATPEGTTRTDGVEDTGVVDMGFHLALSGAFIRGDFDGDGIFNGLVDALASLAFQFQGGEPSPCAEASDADGNFLALRGWVG